MRNEKDDELNALFDELDSVVQVPDFSYGAGENSTSKSTSKSTTEEEKFEELLDEARDRKKSKKSKKAKKSKKGGQSDGSQDGNPKKKKNWKNSKYYKFTRVFSIIYLIALLAFEVALIVMDMLPTKTLIALVAVLTLLSVVIFMQLYFKNVKLWAKIFATVIGAVLFIVYSVGAAYCFGTISFLGKVTNEDNKNSVKVTEEPFNILVTGIDVTGTIDQEGRSDVNMVLTVNPKTGTVLITSIPRDYEVLNGGSYDKLTHTGFYGVKRTINALEDLFDTTMNYYVRVNFSTVIEFVDAIGGVDVESEVAFTPSTNAMDVTGVTDELKGWTVKEGTNHLSGAKALAFARERKAFALGDNQRIRNQQIVMQAMIEKATSSKTMLLSYNKIVSTLDDYMEMNMSADEIRSLVKLQLIKNIDWEIDKYAVTGHDGQTAGGLYIMKQDSTSVSHASELIEQVLNGESISDSPYLE